MTTWLVIAVLLFQCIVLSFLFNDKLATTPGISTESLYQKEAEGGK